MYTPQGGEGRTSSDATRTGESTLIEPCACCLAGLVVTAAVALLFYPALVAATRPLRMLSTTAIVFVLVSVWSLVWLGTELVWEWRAGRVSLPG